MSRVADLNTNKSWRDTLADLVDEFRKWGVQDYVLPIIKESEITSEIKVAFVLRGEWTDLICARWRPGTHKWLERNIRAIYLAINNTRLMDQRGLGSLLAAAAAPLALPSGTREPLDVLGLRPGDYSSAELQTAFRARSKVVHPDMSNGSRAAWDELISAAQALGIREPAAGQN